MMDLSQLYSLEMMRKRRLADTVREDIAWDILVETGGATHTIRVRCLTGQTANIDWGDNTSTEATATTLTSYAHNYPAGTFTISITGGASQVMSWAVQDDVLRMLLIRNLTLPSLVSLDSFSGYVTTANYISNGILDGCKIGEGVTSVRYALSVMRSSSFTSIPSSLKIPSAITTAQNMLYAAVYLQHVPLSLWPDTGFTHTGTINLRDMMGLCNRIVGSVAPSQIFWDSGKTFAVNRNTFAPNNATAWLNYAADYTDPATGITYSKIPYAWGGAAD